MAKGKVSAIFLGGILAFLVQASINAADVSVYRDASYPAGVRAADLVSRMTLKEKIGQLGNTAPAINRLGLPKYEYWSEALHGVARSGPATSFPQANALAATWDPDLLLGIAGAISDEARVYANKFGKGLTYWSPTINMARDPRWGRSEESYGEDPYLTSRLAVAFVRGMQGDDPEYLKTVATVKHFAANNSEYNRHNGSSDVDEATMREYYLPGFKAAVEEAGVFSIMSAYNAVNDLPCSANPWLLTDILRKEWGFKGYVVSDCDAISDIYTGHEYVQSPWEAAAAALKAGTDLNCGKTFQTAVARAITEGAATEADVDRALIRILTARFKLGEFDPPERVVYKRIPESELLSPEHDALAKRAARESMVLLKNQGGILPLKADSLRSIAVIGPNADRVQLGGYSGTPPYAISPLQGIRKALGSNPVQVSYERGCGINGAKVTQDYLYNLDWFELSNGKAVRRVQAEDFAEQRGIVVEDKGEGTRSLGYINHGEYALYKGVDLTGFLHVSARLAAESTKNGGILEIRLDGPDGPAIAVMEVGSTGSWTKYLTVSADLPKTKGKHDIVLKFLAKSPGSDTAGIKRAVEAAKKADVAILVLGTDLTVADEEKDRETLDLPYPQEELAKAVYTANPRTIAVLVTGFPLSINWLQDTIPGIVCAWYGGQAQGEAIADTIFGNANPGGKLTTTWYRSTTDLPDLGDYRLYGTGLGRTYRYFTGKPLYPFGFGLSYTSFGYTDLSGPKNLSPGGTATFSLILTNKGGVKGDEVVQLYVREPGGRKDRPLKMLKAFKRLTLEAGGKTAVTLELPYKSLERWDTAKGSWTVDPGDYDILLGANSNDIRTMTTLKVVGSN